MGEQIRIKAADGVGIGAYLARPTGTPKAGLVVVQEIFGVNHHIRGVTDRLARDGYLALAPAFFDRVRPGVEMGYTADDIAKGREIAMSLKPEQILADVDGGIAWLRGAGCAKVGIVGFCFGGTVAWRAAGASKVDAAVAYYGGGILANRDAKPKVPTMAHFGDKDAHIPVDQVRELAKQYPDIPVHIYSADHGFHCDERASYDAESAKLAYARTLEFFGKELA